MPLSRFLPSISARYETNAGQSITDSTITIINFEDSVWDTLSAVTTGASWKFTAPFPGIYEVSAKVQAQSATYDDATNGDLLYLYKNGSQYCRLSAYMTPNETRSSNVNGTTLINLAAGDYIDVRYRVGITGASVSLNGLAANNWITIKLMDFAP